MKIYIQALMQPHKISGIWETKEVTMDGKRLDPRPSLKARNHSPDGFNWGYGGSGPAQLALAILMKVMANPDAICWHQTFKWDVIARLPQTDFNITIDIMEWMAKQEEKMKETAS